MDKFDDLLRQKADDEKEKFTLPKSFEDKMQQTLDNLDAKEIHKNWYFNKKILAMVACFAFVFLVGMNSINDKIKSGGNPEIANEAQNLRDGTVKNDNVAESYGLNNSRANIDIDGVQSLTIKLLDQDTKYKNVNNQNDILNVINFLRNLEVINTTENIGVEWDFLIQVNGNVNSSIIIKDNIMSVNDEVYEIVSWNKSYLIDLYKSLEYEEKYIKYCPTN